MLPGFCALIRRVVANQNSSEDIKTVGILTQLLWFILFGMTNLFCLVCGVFKVCIQ